MLSPTPALAETSKHGHCAVASGSPLRISRVWAMPNGDTFSIPVIGRWVQSFLACSSVSVDPFARNNRWATHTNDLNPNTAAEHHMEARNFLRLLVERGVKADLVIFDPPYSPRQISECYATAGLTSGMRDTQNARLYSECRSLINQLAAPCCTTLSFGWNSTGMGKPWQTLEILLVAHGAAHNDTICMADRLDAKQAELFEANK